MKLILVHGINQQGKDPDELKATWLGHLARGLGRQLGDVEVVMPFYGGRLFDLTSGAGEGHVVAQGEGATEDGEAEFLALGLDEVAQGLGVSRQQIMAEQRLIDTEGQSEVVAQGFPMHRKINAVVRVIERLSPFHGRLILPLLKQAHTYLRKPGAAEEVDAIVAPHLGERAIVVGHSLGTIVTFKLLRRRALEGNPVKVPLYVTLGSPLPIMAVQNALGPRYEVPGGVSRWLNAIDPDDFITLGSGLTRSSFADGIDNFLDIDNIAGDAHAIEGYLSDARVARAIGEALAG